MSAGAQRFLLRRWPDGAVVFDRRLGHTHAMGSVEADVFGCLLERPEAGQDELKRIAAACLPDAPQAERDARLEQALVQLRQLGLLPSRCDDAPRR